MAVQKKHGKGRLDKWYKLAKEKGYRARAAFKLIQLNKKYNFLQKSKVLIDLCAAPGSWLQVASTTMAPNSILLGLDLAPIKPIPRCQTFQSDITTPQCRALLRQHLKHLPADTVLHDGAPNVGVAWLQDAYSQAELALQALKLASEFLGPGGTFVTKVFRSKDYNALIWVCKQLFARVEATKPPASRSVSAEIFVVCRGFKAPKKIDPRLLDPRAVFADPAAPANPNVEAKVFNPEKEAKKRKRQGYEEGDWTQFHEARASEFVQSGDPIAMLGNLNRLSFEQPRDGGGDLALKTLERLPETTEEVRKCCDDLKVLGRKDFRLLLRWRLKVREIFGLSTKSKDKKQQSDASASDNPPGALAHVTDETPDGDNEVARVESMDDELRMQEELQSLRDQESGRRKRERRRENERRQREIVRLQMQMTTPMEIGLEQAGPSGEGQMFALKEVDKAGAVGRVARGKMATLREKEKDEEDREKDIEVDRDEEDGEEEDEIDELEKELDNMYEAYQERRAESDAKYRAKKARLQRQGGEENEEFEGFSDGGPEESEGSSSGEEIVEDESGDEGTDEEDGGRAPKQLVTDLDGEGKASNGLTKRAALFFDQDIFKGIEGEGEGEDEDSGIDVETVGVMQNREELEADGLETKSASEEGDEQIEEESDEDTILNGKPTRADDAASDSDASFEVVARSASRSITPEGSENGGDKDGRPDISIVTAEAMTLAHELATGKRSRSALVDDGFNKYSMRDAEGLPAWFLDDEQRFDRGSQKPISAAAAAAVRDKLRALNARPIKKVREAKARKKMKAARRLEKLRKKSAVLAEEEGISERDKAEGIAKLMAKAAKAGEKKRNKVKVVVAKGGNRGLKGRPKGTKGRYKMVDARLKKDMRAQKRAAKRRK
ncbi:Spb1 C-terminal domain-containing protein [Lineolata rhizophorae]|uniref:Spb1 C-terminal domain-containing protein n=1 Tax=Lineolata rhizophorae TaxID=578093 RepID=A0A6A6PDR7_9PEZI|nr:Spb1 C-terminal domain-containing protein [Lineolata rhizophorae]